MNPARHAATSAMRKVRGERDAVAILTRRAPPATGPVISTWNADSRTFEAVLSAGSAVERSDARGSYDELLDLMTGPHPLPFKVPLLDSHSRDSVDRVIGHASNIRVQAGELVGLVTLSAHNPQAVRLAAEITDGALYGLSVGYVVERWREQRNPETGRRERHAIKWQLKEVSVVAVPADAATGMRGQDMDEENQVVTGDETAEDRTEGRASVNAEIRAISRTAGLGRTFSDRLIDAEASLEEARAAAFEEMRTRGRRTVFAAAGGAGQDDPQALVSAMGEGLHCRANPDVQPSDRAREFVGLSVAGVARECLTRAGVNVRSVSDAAVVERALGMMTTSDFPQVLGDAVQRSVRRAYAAAPSALLPLARQTTARDFRTKMMLRLAGDTALEKVNEHGEFKSGVIVETGESIKVATYGKIVGITRQALVNDDLNAFASIPQMLGNAAAALVAKMLAELVVANPAMADGTAIFHADHGNLAGSGAAIGLPSLGAGRIAMRRQTDEAGEIVGAAPRYLVVAPEQETVALQAVAEVAAATQANVNVFSGALTILVEPRLPTGAWYLAADPAVIPGLEYAYLEGSPQPTVSQVQGFEVDGVKFRVRLDFGAAWSDWRGWYKNGGG